MILACLHCSTFDGNSLRDERWRFDPDTGHPVYRYRYAFRDGLQSPFHVVDAKSDGTGFHSKSYISTDGIGDLLGQRVNEPKTLRSHIAAGPAPIKKHEAFLQSIHPATVRPQTGHQSSAGSAFIIPPSSDNHIAETPISPQVPPTVPHDLFNNVDLEKLNLIKSKLPVLSDKEILQQIIERLGDLENQIDPKVLKSLAGG